MFQTMLQRLSEQIAHSNEGTESLERKVATTSTHLSTLVNGWELSLPLVQEMKHDLRPECYPAGFLRMVLFKCDNGRSATQVS